MHMDTGFFMHLTYNKREIHIKSEREHSFYQGLKNFSIGCGINYSNPSLHLSICHREVYFSQKSDSLRRHPLDKKTRDGKRW